MWSQNLWSGNLFGCQTESRLGAALPLSTQTECWGTRKPSCLLLLDFWVKTPTMSSFHADPQEAQIWAHTRWLWELRSGFEAG